MRPATRHDSIEHGAQWRRILTWLGIDLTGYTAELVIGSDETTLLTLTDGAGITIDGSFDSTIELVITTAQSAALPEGRHKWRLDVVDLDGERSRVWKGTFRVLEETGA